MKKIIIAVVLMVLASFCFGMSAQVIDVNAKTGFINVTGSACNISGYIMTSWPAHMTLTCYDAVSSTVVDGTTNTIFVFTDQGLSNLIAANTWPAKFEFSMPVVFDTSSTFFTAAKPFAAYKKVTKGIVLHVDAGANSQTGKFFITIE